MTNYDNVIPIYVASKDHNSCSIYTSCKKVIEKYPNGCSKCRELALNHDTDIIVNKIKNILNL